MKLFCLPILLFFTGISPLASGQWESDKFLLNSQHTSKTTSRLKSKKTTQPISPKNNESISSIKKEDNQIKNDQFVDGRKLASTLVDETQLTSVVKKRPPAKLYLKTGIMEIKSRSHIGQQDFTSSAQIFGAGLKMSSIEDQSIHMTYSVSPKIYVNRFDSIQSEKLRWEELEIGYTFENFKIKKIHSLSNTEQFYVPQVNIAMGLDFKRWWGFSSNKDQINSIYLSGIVPLPDQGRWISSIDGGFNFLLGDASKEWQGWGTHLIWNTSVHLNPQKVVFFEVGYQKIFARIKNPEYIQLEQSFFQINIGYQITPK